eukprot:Lithocolla_globosa_v1_NODE_233_length_4960_cov_9.899694.p3 type:complete len:104 gc:universal NODE_233_length_4960_cov_9.899694:3687-3998(+)
MCLPSESLVMLQSSNLSGITYFSPPLDAPAVMVRFISFFSRSSAGRCSSWAAVVSECTASLAMEPLPSAFSSNATSPRCKIPATVFQMVVIWSPVKPSELKAF